MLQYIIRRILMLVPILILMSAFAFFLIQLPPGDFVSARIAQLRQSGITVSADEAERLKNEFGLDQPATVRYWRWVSGIVTRGYWGYSMQWTRPVGDILAERVPMTITISLAALFFSWALAIPIGIYSATHQYSLLDYLITFLGFIGVATPGFLLALIMAWFLFANFGFSALGLYSRDFLNAPMSAAKFADMM